MMYANLSNGDSFRVDLCGAANGILQIDVIDDVGIPALAAAFGDPEATAEITHCVDDRPAATYAGYTRLTGLARDLWNECATLVTLKREEQHE